MQQCLSETNGFLGSIGFLHWLVSYVALHLDSEGKQEERKQKRGKVKFREKGRKETLERKKEERSKKRGKRI